MHVHGCAIIDIRIPITAVVHPKIITVIPNVGYGMLLEISDSLVDSRDVMFIGHGSSF